MSRRSQSAPLLALLALALGGCSLLRSLDDYDSGTGGAASSTASATTTSTSSAGTGGGGGAGGGGSGAASCDASLYPAAASLVDTFDDGGELHFHGCAAQTGGELRVDLPDTGDEYCTSTTDLPYCLSSSAFVFQVAEAATASIPGMQTWIILRAADDSGAISLLIEANGLRLFIEGDAGSGDIDIPNATYDPFTNVWFRIAGEAGDLVLSTSPDAVTWTERGRGPALLSLDGLFLELGANRYYNEAFPDSAALPAETARFDCMGAPGCR